MITDNKELRHQLATLLRGGNAHLEFDEIVKDMPEHLRGERPDGIPFTPWQLLEHLRITQWDILEFIRNPNHNSPDWPDGYWPKEATPPTDDAWHQSLMSFESDLQALEAIASDAEIELDGPIPHADGETYLREILIAADHNAYHLGQMVMLRRLMGSWSTH